MPREITAVLADVYVHDADPQDGCTYWIEGEPARVEIEATDDQVRIGIMKDGLDFEVAGVYLSPSSARDFLVGLGAAIRDLDP